MRESHCNAPPARLIEHHFSVPNPNQVANSKPRCLECIVCALDFNLGGGETWVLRSDFFAKIGAKELFFSNFKKFLR